MDDREARAEALELRTKRFAVDVVGVCHRIAGPTVLGDMARQLARAATSVAANHRAVRRARSLKEFASKLQIVSEEIDEAVHWLDVLLESGLVPGIDLGQLSRDGRELRNIFAVARKTTRARLSNTRHP
ncbi:MAG: four helix bundle protein [Vicinamibacterales bacterium]